MAPADAPRLGTNPGKLPGRGNIDAESRSIGRHWTSMEWARNPRQRMSASSLGHLKAAFAFNLLYIHEEWLVEVSGWKEAKSGNWLANPGDQVQHILLAHRDPLSADLSHCAVLAPGSGLWASPGADLQRLDPLSCHSVCSPRIINSSIPNAPKPRF